MDTVPRFYIITGPFWCWKDKRPIMTLYFDGITNTFSTTPKESYIEVFESFDCKKHEKKTTEKTLGMFTVSMRRDNWLFAHEGFVQWLWVDISVLGNLLLPISMSCRKADTRYHFSEHEIAFQQYGPGHNRGKSPHTYMQTSKDYIDWDKAFNNIVNICNNYSEWITQETKQLIASLETYNRTKFWDIATFIELARRYDVIVPEIIPVYRSFVDEYCFVSMSELIKHIESNRLNRKRKAIYGDIIWNYIKDYCIGDSK